MCMHDVGHCTMYVVEMRSEKSDETSVSNRFHGVKCMEHERVRWLVFAVATTVVRVANVRIVLISSVFCNVVDRFNNEINHSA